MGRKKEGDRSGKGRTGGRSQKVARRQEAALLQRIRQATVGLGVFSPGAGRVMLLGTGVLVDGLGIALTAAHVIRDVNAAVKKIIAEGHSDARFVASVVRGEAKHFMSEGRHAVRVEYTLERVVRARTHTNKDLGAVFLENAPADIRWFKPDFATNPSEGDYIVTCGYPYGVKFHERQTVLSSFLFGRISAIVPHPVIPPDGRHHYLLQMPIQPGNSGGGVFDRDSGKLVAIVSRRYEVGGAGTGLSVAESIHRTKKMLTRFGEEIENEATVSDDE